MLHSYLVLAYRNLRRNARYLLINVLGLGFALGFCILAYLNYQFANTYDHWHRDAARIVRVELVKASNGERYGICPSALGPSALAELSAVESQCRYQPILQAWLPSPSDYTRFNDAVKDIPGVVATTGSVHLPGFGYNLVDFKWQGEGQEAILFQVGNDFPAVMGMRLTQGNWPAPAMDTSVSTEVVVNQTFARQFGGNKNLLGQEITFNNRTVRIAGIVSDFMTDSPFEPLLPALLNPVPMRTWRRSLIKTATTSQQPQVMAAIEGKWKQLFPYTPFNVGYQNEMLREAVEVSDNIASNMAVLGGVALLLSITGLFSLVSLNVLRRMREVAVRRVMGASAGQVAWVLNKSYGWIFGFAVVVGCISGRFLASSLMDSIFKINIGVQASALAWSALGILCIAAATIGIKLWQTLRVNPADVLCGE